jgi:hypothetical protein
VNAQFKQAIQELTQLDKDTHCDTPQDWACGEPPADTVAGMEMQAHIEKLRLVAVSRIRDYFLSQMALLRKPQTNIRILQSHGLLHYADLYDFLLDAAAPDIAQELFHVYTESMSKTLYALFRTYQAQLIQLDATKYAATRQDVLAVEDAYLRDSITTKAKKRVDVCTLGNRANVLDNTHDAPLRVVCNTWSMPSPMNMSSVVNSSNEMPLNNSFHPPCNCCWSNWRITCLVVTMPCVYC